MIREKELIIEDIKNMVHTKGYIYALCMIIIEDYSINPEKLHTIDFKERLSTKETSLLIGFLIQKKIDLSFPSTPQELIYLKQRTYELMRELQESFKIPFYERLNFRLPQETTYEEFIEDHKAFFSKGNILQEPMFYSGTGVYDFQYLEFLERKYKYDKEWLLKKRNFDIDQIKKTVSIINDIREQKLKKIHFYEFEEVKKHQIIGKIKKQFPKGDWDKRIKDFFLTFELYKYIELFLGYIPDSKSLNSYEIGNEEWHSLYRGLLDIFIIRKSDFGSSYDIESLLTNFSIASEENLNSEFQAIGNYNIINSHPIISIDTDRYFIPIHFLLIEAIYESPFHWMKDDLDYNDISGKNRGKVGEEITFELLYKVFGEHGTFKSVKIISKKGHTDTDIDVLCILGSKALCVQVKSKKLTELSRVGNDAKIKKDFQQAVQSAYQQGLISRQKIIDKTAKFIDENKNEIRLSEEIDEVYIMVITTENYPSLTPQTYLLLEKQDSDPYPLALTIFDLELITHYLHDKYDFLYYVRQRIVLMDYFKADEEITFLGYHLDRKLSKTPNSGIIVIDANFGPLISRNYIPLKMGLDISEEGDKIKNCEKNENFDKLCTLLKTSTLPKITDIIFHLLDLSGDARKLLVDLMTEMKQLSLKDGKIHNFSIPPSTENSERIGFTYLVIDSDDVNKLKDMLQPLSEARKYRGRCDIWIGFGSLKSDIQMIDCVIFNNDKWKYDSELEVITDNILKDKGQVRQFANIRKIGRNDDCVCGSRLKYKKCCGR